jgi:hypothetical protein
VVQLRFKLEQTVRVFALLCRRSGDGGPKTVDGAT